MPNENENEKRYCQYEYCTSKHIALPPIGNSRMNGVEFKADWKKRRYHRKCWKEIQMYYADLFRVEDFR